MSSAIKKITTLETARLSVGLDHIARLIEWVNHLLDHRSADIWSNVPKRRLNPVTPASISLRGDWLGRRRAGNSFTVNGPAIGRDSMLLGAGFAIHWNDRISTTSTTTENFSGRTIYRITSPRAFD